MKRVPKFLLSLVFLLQVLFFLFVGQHRFIDGDEGYFLLAARLILLHKKPYLDFFFQQAPLLPYLFALWFKCFQVSWSVARVLPALLTASLGTLLYTHICQQTRAWAAGALGVVMFGSSTLVFAWMTTAKPYSAAALFLFAAYVAVSRIPTLAPRWVVIAAGAMLALAADTRSYLILTVPLFLWWIFKNSDQLSKVRHLLSFLIGLAIGLLPCLYFFILSPSAFFFDNLGYHAIRTDAGLIGMWGEKLVVLFMLLLGGPEGNGIQNSILLVISLAFISSISKPAWPPRLAFQLAILVAAISLLPTPALPQYFSFCIPLLIVSTVCAASDFFSELTAYRARLFAGVACLSLALLYIGVSINDYRKYLITGDGIPTVRRAYNKSDWRLNNVVQVSRAIDQLALPGEQVASFWSGYLVQTHAVPIPGLETDCGVLIADKLTQQQQTQYHIASWSQLDASFADHRPRFVVTANHYLEKNILVPEVMGDTVKNSLLQYGYTVGQSVGDTSIYVCCSKQ